MKLLLTSLLIFCAIASFSQTKRIDSLKNIYYSKLDSGNAKLEITKAVDGISRDVDDFTNETSYRSPLLQLVALTKYIKGGKATYYISFSTIGSTLNTNEKGLYVIFSDGTKWSKPTQTVKVDYDDGYEYSTFTTITINEVKLFQRKKVKKFRLFIYDQEVEESDAQAFQLQAAIMETLK